MKKMYIAPEVETVKVNAVSMLATSGEEGSLGTGGNTGDASGALGREDEHTPSRPNLWEQGW